MIAVDTSVLVDYIGDGAAAEAAEDALRAALGAGPVVACEVVLSEVVAGLGHSDIVMETLEAIGIAFSPAALQGASAPRRRARPDPSQRTRFPDRGTRLASMRRADHARRRILP
jgi:predicted nucleic acid-binding protein